MTDRQGGHLKTFFESIRGAFFQGRTVIDHVFVLVLGFDSFSYLCNEGGGGSIR